MKAFYGDDLLLGGDGAKRIYAAVKDLPIIDCHCHLDEAAIADDRAFDDIGELWLAGDHYKWRAMRLCGVDEKYITGNASYHDKFVRYAEILPRLVGNPLYYWSHLELKMLFGITEPLDADSAERIYAAASEKLKDMRVRDILRQFKVEYIATTDDPTSELKNHGTFGNTTVAPTFRPDGAYDPNAYLPLLERSVGKKITTAEEYFAALVSRLDYFVSKGCKITDHGFERFPSRYIDDVAAERIFARRERLSENERTDFLGWLLVKLTREYKKRGLIMQLHFSVTRNRNAEMYKVCGADSGFDLIAEPQSVNDLILYFNQIEDADRPDTVLYTLNDGNLAQLAAVTGAFRNVRMGAAWWFNDTAVGIKKNLSVIAEYSALGTSLGMLTDSRSFASYVRFDFFRRILADYLGELADGGECDMSAAERVARGICYDNIKGALRI